MLRLENAYFYTTSEEVNQLINNGNYEYLSYDNYDRFNIIKINDNGWDTIQKVVVDTKTKKILGYYEATLYIPQRRIDELFLVDFKYMGYYKKHSLLNEFFNSLINDDRIDIIKFSSIEDNHANKIFEKWTEKYNGMRVIFPNEILLKNNKRYNKIVYYFDKTNIKKER